MKRSLCLAFWAALSACGADKIPDMPTVEIGAGGVSLMNEAKTPFEAYDKAYSELTKYHNDIRRGLDPQSRNRYLAEASLRRILHNLEIMKSLLVRPEPLSLDPYLEFYRDILTYVEQDRYGGNMLDRMDQKHKEIKLNYVPGKVELAAEFARKPASETSRPETLPAEQSLPKPPEHLKDPYPVTPPDLRLPESAPAGLSTQLLYNAWSRSHADLVETFSAKKECQRKYECVAEALHHLKAAEKDAARAAKLETYINYYDSIHRKTRGFTTLPGKETMETLQGELKIVASVIDSMYAEPAK